MPPIMPETLSMIRCTAVFLALAGCTGAPEPELAPPSAVAEESAEPDWAALAAKRLPLLQPCELPGAPEKLLCGTLEVWEDRTAAQGRRIGLKVIVVPAHDENPPCDPVFVFEGGPGGAVTRRAVGMTYAGPVRKRDIVLVDQRGTGGSNPLHCKLGGGEPSLGKLKEMFPGEDVRRCAQELSGTSDLRFYTTAHFADDIEEVRQRLGYDALNVRGGSYGTAAMMTFAQRYPESTRSLFGIASVSPLRSNLAERGVWTDKVLHGVADLCAAQEACAEIAPRLDSMIAEILDQLDSGPRSIEIADPSDPGTTLTLDVGRDWLTEQLRLILYYTFTTRGLAWAAHRVLAADDWEPLVQLAVSIQRMFQSTLAYGVLLTVQCSEFMSFDVDEALARGSATLFGNYRLEQQLQGCANWPHEVRPRLGVAEPRVLDIPTLFLSGALDPVTPPDYADDAAASYFPNSRHVVLAEGQHGPFDLEDSWECVHQVWADFLERGSVEGLDTSCSDAMHRPSFLVDAEGFAQFVEEVLVPMTK